MFLLEGVMSNGEIVEHDGYLAMQYMSDAARLLKESALKDPSTPLRAYRNLFVSLFYGFLKLGWPPHAKRHTAVVGEKELRITVTYRPKQQQKWHLSVLPCRTGVLTDREEARMMDEFGIRFPQRKDDPGGTIHYFWND